MSNTWNDAPDTVAELVRGEHLFPQRIEEQKDVRIAPHTYSRPAPGREARWVDNGDGVRYFVGYVDVAGEQAAQKQREAAAERKKSSAKYKQRETRRAIDRAISDRVWRWQVKQTRSMMNGLRESGQPVPNFFLAVTEFDGAAQRRKERLTRKVNALLRRRAQA